MKKQHFVIIITLFFLLACKKEKSTLFKIKANQNVIDKTIVANDSIQNFIEPFKKHLNKQLDSVLCITTGNLTKTDGELESSLGNLMADICYEQGNFVFKKRTSKNIDFVLLNYGGVRAPIAKGYITARNAFEVMPFENELIVVELSSKKTIELFKYLAKEKKAHPIANLKLKIDEKRNYQNVLINNMPFDPSKNYHILTSDYLQQGGDNMTFFANPVSLHKLDYKLRNALIDYFKKSDSIIPKLDKRFTYAN